MSEKNTQITAKVTRLYKENRVIVHEEENTEVIDTVNIDPELYPMRVSVDRKRTVNMGNFNSVGFGIFVSGPAALSIEGLDGAYDFLAGWADKKIADEYAGIEAYLAKAQAEKAKSK